MTDTILIDSTDIQIPGVRIMQVWQGVHAMPQQRGELLTYPGRDGETNIDQPFGPTVLSIGLMVRGGSPDVTGFNDKFRTLRRLCKPGRTVTLTKQLSYGSGNESYTATAKLRNILVTQESPADYRVVIEFTILDGLWYGAATALATFSSAVSVVRSVLGDVRTQRMTITLSGGGTNPTVSDTTNGWAFTYTGSTASAVVVYVEAMTATLGATDVSQNLSWARKFPFRLDPGNNTLACTSGSVDITYSPAFL